ncbi:DUF2849 domain-containing protein [Nitratireductor sp. GCM10026969]|uniref:DUF2849 domain-containing protein n=1 Tax=Nitratireductor sp. GCM10026969 TaxID=3252645 RepID=UPI0036092311
MKLLTANRLSDGEAVWLAAGGRWVEDIAQAEVAREAETEARLEETGRAAAARNEVVDVNLIDVEFVDGAVRPIRLRERIRAAGPTIHPELGKQARRPALAPV